MSPPVRSSGSQTAPPAFPHTQALRRRFDWGMHYKLFAGGSKRLTPRTFRAYMGYLLVLFLVFAAAVGLPAVLVSYVAWWSGQVAVHFLAGFMAVVIFGGILWFLQNAFWGVLYRFHDMGYNGWHLFVFYLAAYSLDKTLGYVMVNYGLYASVGLFSALLGLVPFLAPGKHANKKVKNKYGFPVEYRWYSFPTPVRICGEVMFWLAVAYVLKELYDILTPSTTPPKSMLMEMLMQNNPQNQSLFRSLDMLQQRR